MRGVEVQILSPTPPDLRERACAVVPPGARIGQSAPKVLQGSRRRVVQHRGEAFGGLSFGRWRNVGVGRQQHLDRVPKSGGDHLRAFPGLKGECRRGVPDAVGHDAANTCGRDEAVESWAIAAGGAFAANARWERLSEETYDKHGGRYELCQWEDEDDDGNYEGRRCTRRTADVYCWRHNRQLNREIEKRKRQREAENERKEI